MSNKAKTILVGWHGYKQIGTNSRDCKKENGNLEGKQLWSQFSQKGSQKSVQKLKECVVKIK
jgi:hypothetical protein